MAITLSQMIHAEQVGDSGSAAGGKNKGILKTEGKEYSFFAFCDTEAVSEAVSKFLQEANKNDQLTEQLLDFDFIYINQDVIEIEGEIELLLEKLIKLDDSFPEKTSFQNSNDHNAQGKNKPPLMLPTNSSPFLTKSNGNTSSEGRSEVIYSSLFSLARSFHTTLNASKQAKDKLNENQRSTPEKESHAPQVSSITMNHDQKIYKESSYDREGNGKGDQQKQDKRDQQKQKDEREGVSQQQDHKEDNSHPKYKDKKKIAAIMKKEAKKDTASHVQKEKGVNKTRQEPAGSIDSIYIRFMALMARILGQAELEAHQLYLRIKERTDAIDALTVLISKINSEKGAIDWTNNEDMKRLIEKARELGVEIPKDKYKWSEEEKKLLKDNIQMRKDSMEKMTQLERTDMQRYLQESSQCHQARSNILKLLKEVTDTIVHNMRPG